MNEYMELLNKPFLKGKEVARVLCVCESYAGRCCREKGIERHKWGYNTDEVIEKFNLKSYIKRQNKKGA